MKKEKTVKGRDIPHLVDEQFYDFEFTQDEIKDMEAMENNDCKPIQRTPKELEELKERYASYARHTIEKRNKKKKITVNLFERDLKLLKAKANQLGLPYQTYLSSLVRQITDKDFEI